MKNKKALIKTLKWAIRIYMSSLLGMLIIRYFFNGLQNISLPDIVIIYAISVAILAIPIYFKNTKDE